MKLEHWPYIVIIILLIALLLKGCGDEGVGGGTSDTVRTETTIRIDSVITVNKPSTVTIVRETVQVPYLIDSSKVITDYFTSRDFEYHYRDSGMDVTFSGTNFKNAIQNPLFRTKNLRPTLIQNTTILAPKTGKVLLGLYGAFKTPQLAGGVLLSYQSKRDRMTTIGYGFDKTITASYQWPIRFRK